MGDFITGTAALWPVFVGMGLIFAASCLFGVLLEERDARHALEDEEDYAVNHDIPASSFRQSDGFNRVAARISANEADRAIRQWDAS